MPSGSNRKPRLRGASQHSPVVGESFGFLLLVRGPPGCDVTCGAGLGLRARRSGRNSLPARGAVRVGANLGRETAVEVVVPDGPRVPGPVGLVDEYLVVGTGRHVPAGDDALPGWAVHAH